MMNTAKRAQWLTPMLVSSVYDWASSYVAFEVFRKVQDSDKQLSFREMFRNAQSPFLGAIYECAVRRTINAFSPVLNLYEIKKGKTQKSTKPSTVFI